MTLTSPMTLTIQKGERQYRTTVPYRFTFPHHPLKGGVGCLEAAGMARGRRAKKDCESGPCARGDTEGAQWGDLSPKLAREWQCREPEPEIRERARRPTVSALQSWRVCTFSIHHCAVGRQLNRRGTGHANRPVRQTQVPVNNIGTGCWPQRWACWRGFHCSGPGS